MNKQRINRTNGKKQKAGVKKFKKTGKPAAKKKAKKRLVTYDILVRKNRDSKWQLVPDKVTASNKILASHIAASRNPNRWVKVLS